MLGQNLDNQQQNFTNKSNNQLFKENGSNNKVSASFTKSLNEIDIQVLKRKINV
jgi:hypothetical protein